VIQLLNKKTGIFTEEDEQKALAAASSLSETDIISGKFLNIELVRELREP